MRTGGVRGIADQQRALARPGRQRRDVERRPRTEKIVALARRNGNSKREFSATGAWVRNQMMKWLLPLGAKAMDFMYAYDARAV